MDCGIVFHILYFGIIVFRHPVLRALVQNKRQWRFESQYSGQMLARLEPIPPRAAPLLIIPLFVLLLLLLLYCVYKQQSTEQLMHS